MFWLILGYDLESTVWKINGKWQCKDKTRGFCRLVGSQQLVDCMNLSWNHCIVHQTKVCWIISGNHPLLCRNPDLLLLWEIHQEHFPIFHEQKWSVSLLGKLSKMEATFSLVHTETYGCIQRHADRYRDMQKETETCRQKQRHADRYRDMQKETETCRQKQRHADRYRDMQTDTETCRQRHADRYGDMQTDTETCRQIQRHADRYRDMQTETETCRQKQRHADRYRDMQTDTETCTQIRRHADRNRDMQTETETCRQKHRHADRNVMLAFFEKQTCKFDMFC